MFNPHRKPEARIVKNCDNLTRTQPKNKRDLMKAKEIDYCTNKCTEKNCTGNRCKELEIYLKGGDV